MMEDKALLEPPLVSVVMPTHNGRRFVAAAIESLQAQDHQALEIFIIDDGSTDGTAGIVEHAASQDDRIIFLRAQHRSIAATRNEGLSRVRGAFISFLDHDDLCPPGKIARQVARLVGEPGTTALFGRTIIFSSRDDAAEAGQGNPMLTMCLSAALFRRDAFDRVGLLDSSFKLADDFDFILRLIESGLEIVVEEEVATFHRRHSGQATADLDATRREMNLALARSVMRRRRAGNLSPLRHPLIAALPR